MKIETRGPRDGFRTVTFGKKTFGDRRVRTDKPLELIRHTKAEKWYKLKEGKKQNEI